MSAAAANPAKRRKEAEREEKRYDDIDLISKLPDEVIHLILSRLSTTEQVFRTKILSKRWRCVLSSLLPLPSIDIDCSRGGFDKKEGFKKFVNWALANRCGGDLESFRLSCLNMSSSVEEVEQWIKAAVIQNIKQLHLTFKPIDHEEINLPHALVSSHTLKVFKLFTFRCPLSLPTFKGGFPALRVLELNNVTLLDPFSVEKFLTTCCPLLQDLSLVDCAIRKLTCLYISSPTLKTLRIDNHKLVLDDDEEEEGGFCSKLAILCPKLVFLEYRGHVAKVAFLHLHSLKKAVLYPHHNKITPELGQTVLHLFAGAYTAESLSINYYFVQCINAADDHLLSLPNLKTLDLTAPMIDSITMNLLSKILEISPKLESIHWVIQQGLTSQQFQTLVRLLDDMPTRRILTRYLKRVEFIEFNGERAVLDVAQFLLERGNALEELVFSWHDKLKYDDKSMEAMNEVSKFYKASPSVKLITLLNN